MSDVEERDSAVFEIALVVAPRDAEGALTILRHYRTGALEDSEIQRLAEALAVPWPEKAVELIGGMEDRFAFYGAVAELAAAMAAAHPEPALALARSIGEPALKAEALRRVAVGQLATRSDFARVLGDEVVELAPHLEDVFDRAHLLAEVARDFGPASREWAKEVADRALAEARQIPEEGEARDSALRAVAWALASIYPDRAEEITSTIAGPAHRGAALAEVARALVPVSPAWAQRLADEALELVPQAAREGREEIVQAAVAALAQVDPRDALAVARAAVSRGDADSRAVLVAANALAESHPQEVLVAAEREQDPRVREHLLEAYVAAAPGRDLDRVLAQLERLPRRRDWLLTAMVEAMARLDALRALDLSRRIADPYARVLALCSAPWSP